MQEVLAGWFAGYTVGIVSTFILAFLALPGRAFERLRLRVFPDVNPVLVAIPAFIGSSILWTAVGLVLGSIYRLGDFAERPDGAGSPSLAFTAAAVLCAIAPLPVLLLFARREWRAWVIASVTFAACFGWMMPLLAPG